MPLVGAQEVAGASGTLTPAQPASYIVLEKRADGTIHPVSRATVKTASLARSITGRRMLQELATRGRNAERLGVTLRTPDGRVAYRTTARVSPWLRGEFHGPTPDAPIDGYVFHRDTVPFVVRVPEVAGSSLVLTNDRLETVSRQSTEQILLETPPVEAIPSLESAVLPPAGGTSANRVDLLVMGDGYTSAQAGKFSSDAAAVVDSFFSISPYAEYRNYFNVRTLFTPSAQSGADHPPFSAGCPSNDPTCCSDADMLSDPLQGTMVSTAFDSRFCAYGIHRLLVSNETKVLNAAAAVPEWDLILLIVNDSTYGGSGGSVCTVSTNGHSAEVAQHEFGHSFVDLADEYESPYPGYPGCSDVSGSNPCEPNVTDVVTRPQIKWQPWINASTPVPTANNPANAGLVGLFLGARYRSTGMYRPGYNCLMRSLGAPFCQVPSQSFVLRLYNGGWGGSISLIEPGTASPAGSSVTVGRSSTQVFRATTLGPVGGPPVQITWSVDGVPVAGETSESYSFTPGAGAPSSMAVTMDVKDATALVHPSMAASALHDSRTWIVSVAAPAPPSTPTLVAPASNALVVDYTPTLDWNNSTMPAGGVFGHYQVQVDEHDDFSSPVVDDTTPVGEIGASTYTPAGALAPNTNYHWRVRAFNNHGMTSAWSAVRTFRTSLPPPSLLYPAEGFASKELRPAFDWGDVPGASGYTLQVSRKGDFTQIVLSANPVASSFVPTSDLPKGTTLHWRVRSRGANGPSASSPGRSLLTPGNPPPAPTMLLPATGALSTDYRPVFTWKPVRMPTGTVFQHYAIQIDDHADFSSPAISLAGLGEPTFTPAFDLATNTRLFWRVRAVNTSGEMGNWSTARNFRTALLPPALVSPDESFPAKEPRPAFDWSDVPGAAGYTIQISKFSTFAPVHLTANPTSSSFVPTADLPKGTTLHWRVRSRGANGPSVFSAQRLLTTPNKPPPAPVLLLPANGSLATSVTPTFSWKAVIMPTGTVFQHYAIQIDDHADFSSPAIDKAGLGEPTFTPAGDLATNTRFFWRVRAVNTSGEMGNWSTVRYVRTAIAPPSLFFPSAGAASVTRTPLFDWSDVPGNGGYAVQVWKMGATPTLARAVTLSAGVSQYLPATKLLADTPYFWRVQTKAANGPSLWSEANHFTTGPE